MSTDVTADTTPEVAWPTCEKIQSDRTLAEKAAYFDEVAASRHLAGDGLLRNLYLTESLDEVEKWYHVDNVILWSGMYLASQAFRYEVTHDSAALDNARTVVAALHQLTQVTNSSGYEFIRALRTINVQPGCQLQHYSARFVRLDRLYSTWI